MLQPFKKKVPTTTDLIDQHFRAIKLNFLDYHQELKEKKILFKKRLENYKFIFKR